MIFFPILAILLVVFVPWIYHNDNLLNSLFLLKENAKELIENEEIKAPTYISKSDLSLPKVDILQEVHKLVENVDYENPKTQSSLITIVLSFFLLIGLIRWFANDDEELKEQELKEKEAFKQNVLNIELPPCQLMDICTVDDKAKFEEFQILESYDNNSTDSPSSDSFERHEISIDQNDSKKLMNSFKNFDNISINSTSTSLYNSPLILQNMSILKPNKGTVGDVTQETVYSTSFSSSDEVSFLTK